MKTELRHILCLILLLCLTSAAAAQTASDSISAEGLRVQSFPESRVLSTTYSLECGSEQAFNTYLSPLSHSGRTIGIAGEWSRPMGGSRLWGMDMGAHARMGFTKSPARNAAMNDFGISLYWRAMRSFTPLPGLSLGAGAGAMLDFGALYLPRNSNNPVAARAYLGVTLDASAVYTLRLWGKNFRIIESVSLPSLGVFFSPHYGQSYYEIYLGNSSGLAHCGWWGNRFAINNLAAVEIPIQSIRLRLGYRLEVSNSIASDIHSRITTHSFVLGISTDWLNVTRRHE